MRTLLLAILAVIVAADTADARKRKHRGPPAHFVAVPLSVMVEHGRRARAEALPISQLVPPDWRLEAQNPAFDAKRYVSPDGMSSLAFYRNPTSDEPVADHMRNFIFAPGETITYLRGERSWVVVSGLKDSKVFYRKAIIACGGTYWHHIGFEYPVELKPRIDPLVATVSHALDGQNECQETVGSARP